MVSRILLCFFLLSSFTANAASYYCEESYKTKLEKIEKNRSLRNAGKVALVVAATTAVTGATISQPEVAITLGLSTLFLSSVFVNNVLDREFGLKQATDFINDALLTEEERNLNLYNYEYSIELHNVLVNLNHDDGANTYFDYDYYVNKLLALEGLQIDVDDYKGRVQYLITNFRKIFELKTPFDSNFHSSWHHTIFQNELQNINYELVKIGINEVSDTKLHDVVAELSANDAFCPKRKWGKRRVPKTLRGVIKTIVKRIKEESTRAR